MSVPPESAFAGYRFHRVLGSGSAAGTFEATEASSGDAVVIESLVGADAEDPDLRDWFQWAWEALAEIQHPNLPQVRSTGRRADVPFAVREPIAGKALPRFLAEGDRLDPASMRVLICRLADGLERAHEAGVIHGALGPDDLIVESTQGTDATGRWVGFGRKEGRRRDDVHALGMVLQQLLEGERATRASAAGPEGEAELTPMDEAILAMLTRVAVGALEGEFTTAAEFRDEVAAGTGPGGLSGRWPKVLALLVILAAAAAVVVLLGGGDDEDSAGESSGRPSTPGTSATTGVDYEVGRPIELSGAPRGVSVRDGAVYVATDELLGFDDSSGRPTFDPIELGGDGGELTVVDGIAYVALPDAGLVARIDLADEQAAAEPVAVGEGPGAVIGAADSIWVANELSGDLSRFDPLDDAAESVTIGASEPSGIAYGFGSLWVSDRAGSLLRIDPADPADPRSYEVGEDPAAVLVTDDRVWVANAGSGDVTGLDPATGETETIDVGGVPVDLGAEPERLWVSNSNGYVSSIENGSTEAARVQVPAELGSPGSIGVGSRVWIGTVRGNFLVPIGPPA